MISGAVSVIFATYVVTVTRTMRILGLLFLAVLFPFPVLAGPLEDAAAACIHNNTQTVLSLLQPLAEKGSADPDRANALIALATIYENGKCGVPQDHSKSQGYVCEAASLGHDAFTNENYPAALSYLKPLADAGDVTGEVDLGSMYLLGRGLTQNACEAEKLYLAAAQQGSLGAQVNLGIIYVTGLCPPQDYIQGYLWFNLAASLGNKSADEYRKHLAEKMTAEQLSEAKQRASKWNSSISIPKFKCAISTPKKAAQ